MLFEASMAHDLWACMYSLIWGKLVAGSGVCGVGTNLGSIFGRAGCIAYHFANNCGLVK